MEQLAARARAGSRCRGATPSARSRSAAGRSACCRPAARRSSPTASAAGATGCTRDHVELVKMTPGDAAPARAGRAAPRGRRRGRDEPPPRPRLLRGSASRTSRTSPTARPGPRARDSVDLAAIACGGRDGDRGRARRSSASSTPTARSSGTRLMVDAMRAWADGQPADRDDAVPAGRRDRARSRSPRGLALQVAEALSGVAHRAGGAAGRRCFFGSFFSRRRHAQRRAVVRHARVGARLARRRPARAPLRAPVPRRRRAHAPRNALDAQAASESAMSLWATYLSGSDLVLHAAGWLEGGLTARYEKFALDLEVLRMFESLRGGLDVERRGRSRSTRSARRGRAACSWPPIHTLEHFREWVFMSPLFRSQALPTWESRARPDPGSAVDSRVEEAARKLRGSRHRRRRRRGAAGVHGAAKAVLDE